VEEGEEEWRERGGEGGELEEEWRERRSGVELRVGRGGEPESPGAWRILCPHMCPAATPCKQMSCCKWPGLGQSRRRRTARRFRRPVARVRLCPGASAAGAGTAGVSGTQPARELGRVEKAHINHAREKEVIRVGGRAVDMRPQNGKQLPDGSSTGRQRL
jgi:hypothetical protein